MNGVKKLQEYVSAYLVLVGKMPTGEVLSVTTVYYMLSTILEIIELMEENNEIR